MRFLVDECTGPAAAAWLRQQNYQVFCVYTEARGLDDDSLLEKAYQEHWILITSDKDFGEKIFRESRPHRGVILLRLEDQRPEAKIAAIGKLLARYLDQLSDRFVVVTETRVRFARK